MSNCPYVEKCPFFNDKMDDLSMIAGYLKRKYCTDKFQECARYAVRNTLGPGSVPADMYPSELRRAQAILQASKTQG